MEEFNNFDDIRLENGLVDLNKLKEKIESKEYTKKIYFKDIKHKNVQTSIHSVYNELIAEELAKDFGLECAHYDIAGVNYGAKCCFSEDFVGDKFALTFKEMLSLRKDEYYEKFNKRCTINEMREMLKLFPDIINEAKIENDKFNKYKRTLTTDEIDFVMNQINKIYVFNILLANQDNNFGNFGIIMDDTGIKSMPSFDNETLLDKTAIKIGKYAVISNNKDYDEKPFGTIINYFSKEENKEYLELFKDKLWIISNENIESVIKRVEERTKSKIDEDIKEAYKEGFRKNNESISKFMNYINETTINL